MLSGCLRAMKAHPQPHRVFQMAGGAAGFSSAVLDSASISSAPHHLLLALQSSDQWRAICSPASATSLWEVSLWTECGGAGWGGYFIKHHWSYFSFKEAAADRILKRWPPPSPRVPSILPAKLNDAAQHAAVLCSDQTRETNNCTFQIQQNTSKALRLV